jgi:hypothetical protein
MRITKKVANGNWIRSKRKKYKKTVMPKKKVCAARNLKDCLPNLPLKTGKAKRKSKFCIATSCASLKQILSVGEDNRPGPHLITLS